MLVCYDFYSIYMTQPSGVRKSSVPNVLGHVVNGVACVCVCVFLFFFKLSHSLASTNSATAKPERDRDRGISCINHQIAVGRCGAPCARCMLSTRAGTEALRSPEEPDRPLRSVCISRRHQFSCVHPPCRCTRIRYSMAPWLCNSLRAGLANSSLRPHFLVRNLRRI